MRMGRDGKRRPNAPPTELEDQSEANWSQVRTVAPLNGRRKIGLVVGERFAPEEAQRVWCWRTGFEPAIEFEDEDGTVVRIEADGSLTVVKPPRQEPGATAEAERVPANRGPRNPQAGAGTPASAIEADDAPTLGGWDSLGASVAREGKPDATRSPPTELTALATARRRPAVSRCAEPATQARAIAANVEHRQ